MKHEFFPGELLVYQKGCVVFDSLRSLKQFTPEKLLQGNQNPRLANDISNIIISKKFVGTRNSQMLHVWSIYQQSIYLNFMINVGKYFSPMKHLGLKH